jgi:small neutral amino acid transporter SnatA (MarC family)
MYKSKSGRTLLDVAMPAALGAGVVTSFAISQGQHPAMAIAITLISTTFAVACYRFDIL